MSNYRGPRHGVVEQDPTSLIDPELPTVDVPSERRFGKVAGSAALLSVACTFAAVVAAAQDVAQSVDADNDDRERLRTLGQSGAGQETATLLRVLSGLLLIVVVLFLYRAIKGRKPDHSVLLPIAGIVSALILAAAVAYQFYDIRDVARDFVSLPGSQQTNVRANDVFDDAQDDALLRITNILTVLASLSLGIWISVTSFEATTVGLLTRFLGLFGAAAGFTTAIPPLAPVATPLFLAWIGSVGVLCLGYWTGGRPPAWETGQATLPWEQQGDRPLVGREPQAEGDA